MKSFVLFLLAATATSVAAFAPIVSQPHRLLSSSILRAEEVSVSAFEAYSQREDGDVAYSDTLIGSGDVAEKGKVITVAYEGRLMSNGRRFDSGTGYSFRLGDGKVIPGWEKGLVGMKVGGKRTLRIPPNLAYADRGARDVIPPGSHLEFDCELVGVANNQMEETMAQVNIQPERIITAVLLLILLAAATSMK